jgi:predicted porin
MNSDTREVGYSYAWVHPPADLYHQLVITNSDGVDTMFRFNAGEATNIIRAIYGKNTFERPTAVIMSKGLWGIFDTLEYGSITLRGGYQERDVSSQSLLSGITSSSIRNSDLTFGVAYDPGNVFIMSEWIQRKSTSKRSSMYASAGYRINKYTPYIGYSLYGAASFLPQYSNPNTASAQSARNAQSSIFVGARWDFMKNADLKMQYDVIKLSADSTGNLENIPASVNPSALYGDRFHVFSVVADFVF